MVENKRKFHLIIHSDRLSTLILMTNHNDKIKAKHAFYHFYYGENHWNHQKHVQQNNQLNTQIICLRDHLFDTDNLIKAVTFVRNIKILCTIWRDTRVSTHTHTRTLAGEKQIREKNAKDESFGQHLEKWSVRYLKEKKMMSVKADVQLSLKNVETSQPLAAVKYH